LLPIFWLTDPTIPKPTKQWLALFLLSMLIRAVVELFMMYVSNNWLHAYGIIHDIFSLLLCLFIAQKLLASRQPMVAYFFYCAILFVLETYFALYLRDVSSADGSVFFLESGPEHTLVLWITRMAVLVSTVIFFYLLKRNVRA